MARYKQEFRLMHTEICGYAPVTDTMILHFKHSAGMISTTEWCTHIAQHLKNYHGLQTGPGLSASLRPDVGLRPCLLHT